MGLDSCELLAHRSVRRVVSVVDRLVTRARRRDLADIPSRAACDLCGSRYPAVGLFRPTATTTDVCPWCVFDDRLTGADPAYLAFQIDRAVMENLAVPAGWGCGTGAAVLFVRIRPAVSAVGAMARSGGAV